MSSTCRHYLLRLISLVLLVLTLTACAGKGSTPVHSQDFGIFLGVSDEDIYDRSRGYELIVTDGQDISAETVQKLKDDRHVVYGYLSIGSLETYRPYYDEFKEIALARYENWPDEYWIDVSDHDWQAFVINTLAPDLKARGFDGVFIDNTDVYYNYPTENTYDGLKEIITGISRLGLPIMINGGDQFVTQLIEEGNAGLIKSICQESVFSRIEDYERGIFARQDQDETKYFKKYVENAAENGIDIYLIEYSRDETIRAKAEEYCANKGFHCFTSESVRLD